MKASAVSSRVDWVKRRKTQLVSSLDAIDKRRVAHSVKVGLALALVSLSVLLQDVFEKVGENALWAILTVVVVFEYTVGATLSKGLNRGLGTISAALLGLVVDYVGSYIGPKLEPVFVGCSVFLIGTAATYTRFVPTIKARYDYGVVIFLLTFCLVVISGYGTPDSVDLVFDRMITVMAGAIICLLVSVFIFPIWAGDDLHKLIINNADGLAGSLEDCLTEYFQGVPKLARISSKICKGQPYDDKIYTGYRGVLISKQSEESLANFANWEPRRGRLGCMYPWKHLVEVGAVLRHCGYIVSALHCCLLSEIQAPNSLRRVFADPCLRIGVEAGRVLREMADDIREERKCRDKEEMLRPVHRAVDRLHGAVNAHPHLFVIDPADQKYWSSTDHVKDKSKPQQFMRGCITQIPTPAQYSSPNLGTKDGDQGHDHISGNNYKDAKHSASLSFDGHIQLSQLQLTASSFLEVYNSKPKLPPDHAAEQYAAKGLSFTIHKSIAFAESLSLACTISMLLELVARLDHLLNAVIRFQDEAGFKKANSSMAHQHCKDGNGGDDDDYNLAEHHVAISTQVPKKHRKIEIRHPSDTTNAE